jgi:hypothetical protein
MNVDSLGFNASGNVESSHATPKANLFLNRGQAHCAIKSEDVHSSSHAMANYPHSAFYWYCGERGRLVLVRRSGQRVRFLSPPWFPSFPFPFPFLAECLGRDSCKVKDRCV